MLAKKLDLKVLQIALPLILSNLTIPLLGFINTLVVGRLAHSYYLGAVGLGTMIFNFLYWLLSFFRMGTTSLIARQLGGKDYNSAANILFHSLFIALLIGLLLIILQIPIEQFAFTLIGGTELLRHITQSYFFIRIWAAPAALMNFVILGALIGLQRSAAVFLIMTVTNVVAIILDVVLVFGFSMAANGVALADVIGQYSGLIIGLLLLIKLLRSHFNWRYFQFNLQFIRQIFSANRDLFIRTLCLIIAFSFFTAQSAKLGITVLAANTVLMNFQMIMSYALDGFANAAETLVGHSVGKKDYAKFKQQVINTGYWSAIIALSFTLIYWLIGPWLIDLMTSIPSIQQLSHHYLIFAVLAPLIAVWCYWLDGVFIGAGRFSIMRNMMLLSILGYFLVWYFTQAWLNTGLWLAMLAFLGLRGLSLSVAFLRLINKTSN